MRAFVGYGSNLGDRLAYIRDAVVATPDRVGVSRVYESPAMGGPPQGPYLNVVAELDTELSPLELLRWARGREQIANRIRGERWGPRTLDVDLLVVGDVEMDTPELTLPHPRMHERPFVLAPLADLDPSLVPADLREWSRSLVRDIGALDLAIAPGL